MDLGPTGVAPWLVTTEPTAGWADQVRDHVAWRLAPNTAATAALREQSVALARQLALLRDKSLAALGQDAWQDTSLALRISDHLSRLLDRFEPGTALGSAEAAILATMPLIHETAWSIALDSRQSVGPADLAPSMDATAERAAFERYAQTFAQPYRRAVAAASHGERAASAQVGWWLLHRWATRAPAAYRPVEITELTAGLRADDLAVLAPGRVGGLLRAARAGAAYLRRTDPSESLSLVAPDGVRETFVGYLLSLACALAAEPVALPDVILEHLAIGDPVSPADLRTTVRGLTWESRGAALVLSGHCGHPAIEVALTGHAEIINDLLAQVHRATVAQPVLAGLRSVPTQVLTDGLRPAQVDGAPAYESAGVRFRLAEDRVRELLMGEQLYGDPALAVRELYQNALDACRYRRARTEFLNRTGHPDLSWSGKITFAQGEDQAGRPFLDCVDNGIGMGVRELSDVFSQAGLRASDLAEFLEEQDEWSRLDPPVQLFPNSRFGIGVLSYFMLADEITVDTCRLGRDGRPGPLLRVSIAGPGSLFRIRTLGPGAEAGTKVRLHLRSGIDVSCVETLRNLLWVADFDTEATYGANSQVWSAGQLSSVAKPNRSDSPDGRPRVAAAPHVGVWWCQGEGAILADGLRAGQEMFGAVVNLTRDQAPRLSVDRTKMLAYRNEDVDQLLYQAMPALVEAGSTVLTYEWLYELIKTRPLLADVIFEEALRSGYRQWRLAKNEVDAGVLGCFPSDAGRPDAPDELVEWRITALAAAGAYRKVVTAGPQWHRVARARPTDCVILSASVNASSPWLDPAQIVPLVHLVRAAIRLGRGPSEIAARLTELGYRTEVGHESIQLEQDDPVLTSRDLDASPPWLDPARPVSLAHLIRAVKVIGRPAREVMRRLQRLGFTIESHIFGIPIEDLDYSDLVLTSQDFDGVEPWLEPETALLPFHLIRAAAASRRPVADVTARLITLGYRVRSGWEGLRVEPDDLVILSRDLDGARPWLDPQVPVSPMQLVGAARKTGLRAADIGARLATLGLSVAGAPELLDDGRLTPEDLIAASRDLDGVGPWLPMDKRVSIVHLARASAKMKSSITDVAARLTTLGYEMAVEPERILVDKITSRDRTLISVDADGEEPYLDPAHPVSGMHVVRVAQQVDEDVHAVIARLAVLGYTAQDRVGEVPVDRMEHTDLVMMSDDLDGVAPWLEPEEEISVPHVMLAAKRTHRPFRDVAERLEQLGFRVSPTLALVTIDKIKSSDLLAASADLDRTHPWLKSSEQVPVAHLLGAALELGVPLTQVAARLSALGYRVPELDVRLPRAMPGL